MSEKQIKGEATGHNGIITYEVDVTDDRIEDLKIIKHSETSGIFDQVIDKLKSNIIDGQSFDVDTISGATVMTQAILDSAKNAVDKENVKLTPVNVKKEHVTKRIKTDVVVIGGGEAGLVAASKALSMGQRVVLLEKNGYLGGATILNGSNVVGTGSETSAKIFGSSGDTPQRLADDVERESLGSNYQNLTKLMAKYIGPAIDFISGYADLKYERAQTQTPEHSVNRQIELPSASSYEFIQKVSKAFERNGGTVLLGARVENLLFNENGKVNGVLAEGDSTTYKVRAHSVVLATGGHGASQEMRGQESNEIDYYGPMTSTGDAYKFNSSLQLKTHNLGWYKIYPHGVEVEPGIAKLTTYASKMATDMGAIYVNSNGKRIVNESDVYTKFRDAILRQADKIAYVLMDKRTWTEFYNLLVMHDFTEKEIAGFFKNEDHSPVFVKGSLKEVSEKAGVNIDNLTRTVKEYQKFVANGSDPSFGRAKEFLHTFEGEEYYLVEQRGRFATTLGGYSVYSDKLNLVDVDDDKVPNYFAAGEVVGGANGHDSMPSMMNTWGISSGYVAGEAASENAEKLKLNDKSRLVALVGTNASHSYNRQVLYAMKEMFEAYANIEICEIKDYPMYNEDLLNNVPSNVLELSDKIDDADGVIIGVPEYDHAIPAALKSIIEWLSSAEHPFTDKEVMIVGTSLGNQGTVRAQINLRQILDAPGVDAKVMPGNEFMLPQAGSNIDEDNHITDYGSEQFLKQCFNNFLEYIGHPVNVKELENS